MSFLEPIAAWYRSLSQRDRKLVWMAGTLLVLLVIYLAVVQPLASSYDGLHSRVVSNRKVLQWIDHNGPVLRRLEARTPGGSGPKTSPTSGSLFTVVSESVQNSPIASSVRQLRRAGAGRVTISLSRVPFDALIRWLGHLSYRHGVVVTRASLTRGSAPGTVNASLRLKRSP